MNKLSGLSPKHPLIGTWIGDGEDSRCEYTISVKGSSVIVKAIDAVDGEEMEISDVKWDGTCLRFNSLMLSTGRIGKNVMKIISDKEVEFKFTFTVTDIWRKKVKNKKV